MPDIHSAAVNALRRDFPLIQQSKLAYLDNAATTQKPEVVLQAIQRYYREYNANVHRAAHQLSLHATQSFEQARATVARFINASRPEEIIWTRGATEAINLLAHTLGAQWQAGDQILVSEMEHHANIVPWQLLAARTGVEVIPVPVTADGEIDQQAYRQLLNPAVKLVAMTQVSNALGTLNPVGEMIALAHQAGALALIDGAQAVAHIPLDLQELDCDFYVFSGHKVYGPTGIGVLYGKYALLDELPPWQGGGEMISRVSFSGTRFQPPPLRFEAGTPPIAAAIGLAAALEYLEQQDRQALQAHEQHLLQYAWNGLQKLPGVRVIGAPTRRCGSLSFVVEGHHSLDIGSYLDQRGVAIRTGHHCCMPLMDALQLDGTARLSVACYSSVEEVQRLLEGVADYLGIVTPTEKTAITSQPSNSERQADMPHPSLTDQLRNARSRDQRHTLLMKAGASPLSDDPELHQPQFQLHGCTSKVWLRQIAQADSVRIELDSDARVIRGLIRVVLEVIEIEGCAKVAAFDFDAHFAELGLLNQLSPSRTSGLRAIVDAVRAALA